MRNKVQLIDVNILSTYLGRWLSIAIFVGVGALAVSALLHGGASERNIIRLHVPSGGPLSDLREYEPLRALLTRETRRPVVVVSGSDVAGDLYLMTGMEFVRHAARLGLEPVAEVSAGDRHPDAVVLVTRPGDDLAPVPTAHDVAFLRRTSLNGFWLPYRALLRRGMPSIEGETVRDMQTGEALDARSAVMGVRHGFHRVAVCTMSQLHEMIAEGVVENGQVHVAYTEETVPEYVVAARHGEAAYYAGKLASIGEQIAAARLASTDETIDLLRAYGIRSLRPVERERMRRLRQLYDDVAPPVG